MRFLGVPFVLLIVGVGVYFGLVHPSWQSNSSESLSWSKNCVEHTSALEAHDAPSGFEVSGVRALEIRKDGVRAVVLFTSSAATASEAARELTSSAIRAGATRERLKRQLETRGADVLLFANQPPSASDRRQIAKCVYEIRENRWGAWTGWNTKTIARPFVP